MWEKSKVGMELRGAAYRGNLTRVELALKGSLHGKGLLNEAGVIDDKADVQQPMCVQQPHVLVWPFTGTQWKEKRQTDRQTETETETETERVCVCVLCAFCMWSLWYGCMVV